MWLKDETGYVIFNTDYVTHFRMHSDDWDGKLRNEITAYLTNGEEILMLNADNAEKEYNSEKELVLIVFWKRLRIALEKKQKLYWLYEEPEALDDKYIKDYFNPSKISRIQINIKLWRRRLKRSLRKNYNRLLNEQQNQRK